MRQQESSPFLKKRTKKLLSPRCCEAPLRRGYPGARALAALAAALIVTACASADPTYYTLQPQPGTTQTPAPIIIEIRRPGLAGYLDRSDVVLQSANYKLDVNTQTRWAEPLSDMIARILAENLTQRLPTATIFTQSGAISANPTLRLEVDILNFTTNETNQVTLTAQIAIERGTTHTPLTTRAITLTTQPAAPGPAPLAAALSTLMAQLSDAIATQIHTSATSP